jgi:hypothetical protein
MKTTKADIDPRLQTQIAEAGDRSPVEALLMLNGSALSEVGEQVLERVCRQVSEQPLEVRVMPRLGALFVKGSGKLIHALLQQKEVVAASANEDDVSIPER